MKSAGIVAAALLLAACSPQVYPLHLDVRQPSSSGMNLSGKSISIVYMDGTNAVDSLFDRQAASSLARKLEADYFGGQEAVGLYRTPSADSVSLELMHSLVMETGDDVVFLLSTHLGEPALESNREVAGAHSVDSAYVCPVSIPVKTRLQVYDSMGQDVVTHYSGSAVLHARVYNNGAITDEGLRSLALRSLDKQAEDVAGRISSRFVSEWKTESFSFYYFDDSNATAWISGLEWAAAGRFSKAVDAWAPLLKRGNLQKRACAAYNIAQAFYLMEDLEMASLWLDEAEKWENVSLSPGLRKRIADRLEKLQK